MTKLKKSSQLRFPSPSAVEDEWQREATREAIKQARAVVSGGAVPPMTPIARLSDIEWGWVCAAILFGWIRTRSAQAASNGVGYGDAYIRNVATEPDPRLAGAVAAILPELARPDVDWTKSLAEFSREEMIGFLIDAYTLISKAIVSRDKGEKEVTSRLPNTGKGEAEPWSDPIPF
jgi:hypothetical protein